MFKFRLAQSPTDLLTSTLYDESTFYPKFMQDLKRCKGEAVIESPFITNRRLATLLPIQEKLKAQKVRLTINTRDPDTQTDEYLRSDARRAVSTLQHMGVHVRYTGGHHRKLAILDRQILYEGSLNILSQNDSREIMRRTQSAQIAWQMARFVGVDEF
jgi:hypothetical protein